jgi:hypothetical protein
MFNLHVIYNNGGHECFSDIDFKGCDCVNEVRSWLNECERFINFGNTIINLDSVLQIEVTKKVK